MRTRNFVLIIASTAAVVLAAACFPLLAGLPNFRVRPIVRVRVLNRTGYDFQKVAVEGRDFGGVRSEATSAYHLFAGVYDHSHVEAHVASRVLTYTSSHDVQPEEFLAAGSYTLVLTEGTYQPDELVVDRRSE